MLNYIKADDAKVLSGSIPKNSKRSGMLTGRQEIIRVVNMVIINRQT